MKQAKLFAVMDAEGGRLAGDLSLRLGSWASSRGISVLLVGQGHLFEHARSVSDAARFMKCLDSIALRGSLALKTEPMLGAVSHDSKIDGDMLKIFSSAYSLILFVGNGVTGGVFTHEVETLPALIAIDTMADGGVRKAKELIEEFARERKAFMPVAFSISGADAHVAERLAGVWKLAFWGFADQMGELAGRIMERAKAISQKEDEVKTQKRNECSAEAVEVVLNEIRKDVAVKHAVNKDELGNDKELLREDLAKAARKFIASMDGTKLKGIDTEEVVARVVEHSIGFGPIEALMHDPTVTEIVINGPHCIYAERGGLLEKIPQSFVGDKQLMALVERLLAEAGRRIDESSPMADARLSGGSRINVVIPPLAVDGPCVTIRKFAERMKTFDVLVGCETLSQSAARFLSECVKARLSIVVSGGTGSGKTTLLNVLASAIDPTERVITIEDAAELKLRASHVVRLEARPPNIEGAGAITIRDLVRNALRMRPDRIIVGECRGAEALDMLQAMNTGHEGSLTTVHANSPRDAISRLETMVLMAGMDLPLVSVREQIVRAVNLIVQISRQKDGSRKVVSITEVVGMEGTVPSMQSLAEYSPEEGLIPTGLKPRFSEGRDLCFSWTE